MLSIEKSCCKMYVIPGLSSCIKSARQYPGALLAPSYQNDVCVSFMFGPLDDALGNLCWQSSIKEWSSSDTRQTLSTIIEFLTHLGSI